VRDEMSRELRSENGSNNSSNTLHSLYGRSPNDTERTLQKTPTLPSATIRAELCYLLCIPLAKWRSHGRDGDSR
jgi:hypothetical protein